MSKVPVIIGTDQDIEALAGKDLSGLNMEEAEDLHKALAFFIERDRDLYYNSEDPPASDSAYDARIAAFKKLEELWPSLASAIPGKVGSAPRGRTLRHPSKMLSLEDVFSKEELEKWYEETSLTLGTKDLQVSCEVKIDGMAVDLVYEDGILASASTRGDGLEGEDITENAMSIPSIPQKLGMEGRVSFLEVRGEAFMRFDDFNRLNQEREREGKSLFANPRNAAAGALRQKNLGANSLKKLTFLAHGLGRSEWKKDPPTLLSQIYSFYRDCGIPVSSHRSLETSFEGIWKMAEKLGEERDSLEHPLDGMVVKVNDLSFQERLGATSHAPRWAVAYKYPAQEAHTLLKGISIQVGRTGKVTPIAELEPVLLAGSTISRATLHNGQVAEKKRIMIGDTVVVKKAGDIIPEIISPVLSARNPARVRPFSMPSKCPYCGADLVKSDEGEGADLRCPNREGCPAQIVGRLLYIAGRKIFDIDELGEESAYALAWPEKGRPSPEKYMPGLKEIEKGSVLGPSSPLPRPQTPLLSSEADLFSLKKEDLAGVEVWREIPLTNAFEKEGRKKRRVIGGSGYFDRVPIFRSSSGRLKANAEKMLEEIDRARNVDLSRLLSGLCISHLGPDTSKLVSSHFKGIEKIKEAKLEDLESVKGIGRKTAQAIFEYFRTAEDPESFEGKIFASWIRAGLGKGDRETGSQGPLSGLSFVVTGTLEGMSRVEAEKKIEEAGGKVSSSLSSKTDYLLAGQKPGSKLARAEAMRVKIIGKEELEKLLGE